MAHDDPFAGKTVNADWAYYLDTSGTFTPELTATTTDPDLGADGTAEGFWHRNGHLITAWVLFEFSGAGVDAGSGAYEMSMPFPIDTSIMATAGSLGAAAMLGSGYLRDDSTPSNSELTVPFSTSASLIRLAKMNSTGAVTDASPFTWATGDRISISFAYLADPAGLPT